MADLAVTAANVLQSSSATLTQGIAGASITVGQTAYVDASGRYQPANALTSVLVAKAVGICVSGSSAAGQPVVICTRDPVFTPGFTSTIGTPIYQSGATAGNMTATAADIATTGYFNTVMGIMVTTTTMNLNPTFSSGSHA